MPGSHALGEPVAERGHRIGQGRAHGQFEDAQQLAHRGVAANADLSGEHIGTRLPDRRHRRRIETLEPSLEQCPMGAVRLPGGDGFPVRPALPPEAVRKRLQHRDAARFCFASTRAGSVGARGILRGREQLVDQVFQPNQLPTHVQRSGQAARHAAHPVKRQRPVPGRQDLLEALAHRCFAPRAPVGAARSRQILEQHPLHRGQVKRAMAERRIARQSARPLDQRHTQAGQADRPVKAARVAQDQHALGRSRSVGASIRYDCAGDQLSQDTDPVFAHECSLRLGITVADIQSRRQSCQLACDAASLNRPCDGRRGAARDDQFVLSLSS